MAGDADGLGARDRVEALLADAAPRAGAPMTAGSARPPRRRRLEHALVRRARGRVRAGELGPDPADPPDRRGLHHAAGRTARRARRRLPQRGPQPAPRRAPSAPARSNPGRCPPGAVEDCAGAEVAGLLEHPAAAGARRRAGRLSDARRSAHPGRTARSRSPLPAGSSLEKSRARAQPSSTCSTCAPGGAVLVVGVVNSLLEELRSRGSAVLPCDLKGGTDRVGRAGRHRRARRGRPLRRRAGLRDDARQRHLRAAAAAAPWRTASRWSCSPRPAAPCCPASWAQG